MMKLRGLVLALALLLPSTVLADPITTGGVWSNPAAAISGSSAGSTVLPFWSGASWDCKVCGVGFLINAYGTEGLEYLHDGQGKAANFKFGPEEDITPATLLFSITAWTGGVFGRRADGAFTYDSGTGHTSNSWDNGEQYALFRLVGPTSTRYFLGIEDILVSYEQNDHDHNDYVVTFSQPRTTVPEPSSMVLFGFAAAVAGFRKMRTGRKAV